VRGCQDYWLRSFRDAYEKEMAGTLRGFLDLLAEYQRVLSTPASSDEEQLALQKIAEYVATAERGVLAAPLLSLSR
jgi:hypothetical protein